MYRTQDQRTLFSMPKDFSNIQAVVMGLGLFGGGEAVVRHLAAAGARVLITDLRSEKELSSTLFKLKPLLDSGQVTTRLGEHATEDFLKADLVVVNPAIPQPWENPFLIAAESAGADILTEIRMAIGTIPAERVIGVTGSSGKSTTSAMIHHAMNVVYPELHPTLGGNIGGSLLDTPPVPDATLILELSSFMLYWLATDATAQENRFTPATAVLTNITPNHLDWHSTMEHYVESKHSIFTPTIACSKPHKVTPDEHPCSKDVEHVIDTELDLSIPGEHNRDNARLAILSILTHLKIRKLDDESELNIATRLARALDDFPGLPHRLHHIGVFSDIECVNDSKSTTPEATLKAIESLAHPSRIHLIAGGYDKGSNLEVIARLHDSLAGLYTIGDTGRSIASDGGRYCQTIEGAVKAAAESARPGDVLLLSPGCASWDQFSNFEARGIAFETAVRQILG